MFSVVVLMKPLACHSWLGAGCLEPVMVVMLHMFKAIL